MYVAKQCRFARIGTGVVKPSTDLRGRRKCMQGKPDMNTPAEEVNRPVPVCPKPRGSGNRSG